MAQPKRRTQEERSAETRTRLLDATIDCLYELGYARTTTPSIAERAGLSRGAQLHHFPTKSELVVSAVEHLIDQCNREFRDAFARLPPGEPQIEGSIDLLWSIISGKSFYAWLELVVAGRTDPELGRAVTAMSQRLVDSVRDTFRELFPRRTILPDPDLAPAFAFALLEGLALDRIAAGGESPRVQGVLAKFRMLAKVVMT